jgi:hypothetical protein
MANVRSNGNVGVQEGPDGDALSGDALNRDERWLLIERVLASAAFRKAGRLRELLRYLAELSVRSHGGNLTEQQIGEAVFGKPSGYSPVEDSSVRVHMRQLRLKLHEYFDSDGREEPLIVEIPKGSYALAFHAIPVPAAPVLPMVELPKAAAPRVEASVFRTLLPWLLAAGFATLSIAFWIGTKAPSRVQIPWPLSAVFNAGDRTQIVLADATYGIRRLLSGKPASLDDYVKRNFQQEQNLPPVNGPESYLARYSADALLTSWADVALATTFVRLLPGRPEQVYVRSARDLRLRDLKEFNYIFLGSPASNPWVLLFEDRLNFQEVRGDEMRSEVWSSISETGSRVRESRRATPDSREPEWMATTTLLSPCCLPTVSGEMF